MSKKRVLIADDTVFHRAVLKDLLVKGGFDVVGEAENGQQAIEKSKELRPDIVILDVVMPVKNGIEAAREISSMENAPKVVMCTSLGFEPIVEEAMRNGASAYVMKPLHESKVLGILKAL